MFLDFKNQSDFTYLFSASSIGIEIYTFLMTTNQYWWNTNKHLGLKKITMKIIFLGRTRDGKNRFQFWRKKLIFFCCPTTSFCSFVICHYNSANLHLHLYSTSSFDEGAPRKDQPVKRSIVYSLSLHRIPLDRKDDQIPLDRKGNWRSHDRNVTWLKTNLKITT